MYVQRSNTRPKTKKLKKKGVKNIGKFSDQVLTYKKTKKIYSTRPGKSRKWDAFQQACILNVVGISHSVTRLVKCSLNDIVFVALANIILVRGR